MPTGSRASTRCCPPSRGRPGSSTSATTWPAGSPARSGSARTWSARWDRPGTRARARPPPGCAAPASASASGRPAALFTIAGDPPARIATGPQGASGLLRGLEDPATADRSGLAEHEDTRPSPERVSPPCAGSSPRPASTGLRLLARVGRIDPDQPHGLPRQRRLPRAPDGHRDGAASHGGGDHHRRGPGPRRRRVPRRAEVGRRGGGVRHPQVRRVQRGRGRAGHVQGPGDPRGGPVQPRGGDDDRGLRRRCRARVPLHPRRVPAGRGTHGGRHRQGTRARAPRPGRHGRRLRLRHRDPARRRRLHLRRGDRAARVHRGPARRAAQEAAVPRGGRASTAGRR